MKTREGSDMSRISSVLSSYTATTLVLMALTLAVVSHAQQPPGDMASDVLGSMKAMEALSESVAAQAPAARSMALGIPGANDQTIVRVYTDTLELAAEADLASRLGVDLDVIKRFSLGPKFNVDDPRSIVHDPDYVKNHVSLIHAERVVGPGGIADETFADCVAIGSDTDWCCTGTLIAPNVVLTAGHCDCGHCNARVFVGVDVSESGQIIDAIRVIRHPDYKKGTNENDLTLLILAKEVNGVTPRRIATTEEVDAAISVRIIGYGNTDLNGMFGYGIRRFADVPVASCACSRQGDSEKYGCHNGQEMVCGRKGLNIDTCTGDSGGPALIEVGKDWLLAGATSRATKSSTQVCGDGGNYVRVDKYVDWIKSVPGVALP